MPSRLSRHALDRARQFVAEADWKSLLTRRTIEVLAAHDLIEPA